jgi:hypothetical protein
MAKPIFFLFFKESIPFTNHNLSKTAETLATGIMEGEGRLPMKKLNLLSVRKFLSGRLFLIFFGKAVNSEVGHG